MPLNRRLAGALLHPISLPGPYGIGDIGPAAFEFIDWLRDAGMAYWQVLPLGPTSFGDSPYQCFSAFAGNPLLVSPDLLVREGLVEHHTFHTPHFSRDHIDYGAVIPWKMGLIRRAFDRFCHGGFDALRGRYEAFHARADVAHWLEDYCLFMACKDAHQGAPWNTWEPDLRAFKAAAVKKAREEHAAQIAFHRFAQFLFFDQWDGVRAACRERGIEIVGDVPIYVAYDSADTWANQKCFELDDAGTPLRVAGVPPDYFCATGQLWGNPLYNWKRLAKDGYQWWINRMKSVLALVDIVRLDHFRGFMGYYAVPFGAPTAENGEWVRGPGEKVFVALREALGGLPVIAEDLGEITVDVHEARRNLGLPGMAILQFAWNPVSTDPLVPDPNNHFVLHRNEPNMVIYTGTHDNDTTMGWWRNSANANERMMLQVYLSTDGHLANWDLIRAAFMSVANTAIVPVQDFLGLGGEARMNTPGRAQGNWGWRLHPGQLKHDLACRVRDTVLLYERCAAPPENVKISPPKKPEY